MTEASEKVFSAAKKHGETFLLWLLCTAALSAVLYVYTENAFNIYTLAGSAAAFGLIKAFDFFRRKKFGGFIYFGTLVTVFAVIPSLFIGRNWDSWFAFIRWFFSGAQAEETVADFMLTLMPLDGILSYVGVLLFYENNLPLLNACAGIPDTICDRCKSGGESA